MGSLGRVAVTGASGFVGRHLLRALRDRGPAPIAVARRRPEVDGVEHRGSDYSPASLVSALAGADAVVHLAARRAERGDPPWSITPYLGPNLELLEQLAEAAEQVGARRIVFASSRLVYPAGGGGPWREGRDEAPLNAYGLSKLFGERYLDAISAARGLSVVSLRFSALYGAGERTSPVLMRFVDLARRGEPLTLVGDVEAGIDQLAVGDAVDAVLAALERAQVQGPVNVGSGAVVSVREMAATINEVFANPAGIIDQSEPGGSGGGAALDITRAAELLGWRPRRSLVEGLEEMRRELGS